MKRKRKSAVKKEIELKDIPPFDRPREKMQSKGVQALSNLELLAAILGTGSRGKDVFKVAAELLKVVTERFEILTVDSMKQVAGIGTARACQVLAALEFSRRFVGQGVSIGTAKEVYHIVSEVAHQKQEYFLTLTVDGDQKLIQKRTIFAGTLNQSLIHPREVFADAITDRAAGIILVHNHPSGDNSPSPEDLEITRRLQKIGKIMGIEIVDHVIVSRNGYYGFQKAGHLEKPFLGMHLIKPMLLKPRKR